VTLVPNEGNLNGPFQQALADQSGESMSGEVAEDARSIKIEQATPLGPIAIVLKKTA
jgi:hypothetical protein